MVEDAVVTVDAGVAVITLTDCSDCGSNCHKKDNDGSVLNCFG